MSLTGTDSFEEPMNLNASFKLEASDLKAYRHMCIRYSSFLIGLNDPAVLKKHRRVRTLVLFVSGIGLGLLCAYVTQLFADWVNLRGSMPKRMLLVCVLALFGLGFAVARLSMYLSSVHAWKYMFQPFVGTLATAEFDATGCRFKSGYSSGRINWNDRDVAFGAGEDSLWILTPSHQLFVPQRSLDMPVSRVVDLIEAHRPSELQS